MEKPGTPPATIRLEAEKQVISQQGIANALYASLQVENKSTFSWWPRTQSLSRKRYYPGDFRYGIMAGLLDTLPLDEGEQVEIKQTLKVELEKYLRWYSKHSRHLTGEELTKADRRLNDMQLRVDSRLTDPLSEFDVGEFNAIRVQGHIQKMLDDDVASERLMVSSIGGKDVVLLDHLVSWAILRKIKVVQDALPGCTSFVHASYQRVHQHMMDVAQNLTSATSGSVKPAEAAPVVTDGATGEVRDWKNIVRAEAWEQWVKTLAENGSPTLENVARHLAVWCVTNKINGNVGKPPMAGYIRTHVICSKYWQPPRNMGREAAKKHLEQKEHAKQTN